MIDVIYCADNEKYGRWAKDYIYVGTQLPNKVYFDDLRFGDQDWKHPNRDAYLSMLRQYKPHIATVLDWERWDQRDEVLGWAEDAAAYSDVVVIIPKCGGSIAYLNEKGIRTINGKQVRLGYSVPTSHGGTELFIGEFVGWPIHALGGSPKRQLELARYLNVASADGNYIHHKVKHGQFYNGNRWLQLREAGYNFEGQEIPEAVFRLSLPNYLRAFAALHRRSIWSITA
jgi:hypothetical protein